MKYFQLGGAYWRSLTVAPDGHYYSSPGYDTSVLKVAPNGDAIAIPTPVSSNVGYGDIVLAQNGRLYAIPFIADDSVEELFILEIDLQVDNDFDSNIALSPYWNN